MRIAVQRLNNTGVILDKSKYYSANERYVKQFYSACNELYSLGYANTPSYLYVDDCFNILFDTYTNLSKYFFDALSGKFMPTIEHIEFALKSEVLDDEIVHILNTIKSGLEAKQALDDFALLNDTVKFTRKSNLASAKTRLSVSRGTYNTTKVPLDSKFVQQLFYLEDDMICVSCDYTICLITNIAQKLGVSPLVVTKYFEDNKSIFLGDGFTFEDDCYFYSLLINGEIIGKGEYGQALYNYIENYYREYYDTRTTMTDCVSVSDKVYLDSTEECVAYINSFRNTLDDYDIFYVDSNKVTFKIKGNEVIEDIINDNYYVGSYVVDFISGEFLDKSNQLLGFSGEYVSEFDLEENKMKARGIPVQLHSTDTNGCSQLINYYPLCMCYYIDEPDEIILPLFTYSKNFKWRDIDETCKYLEVKSLEEISDEVAKCLSDAYDNDACKLIGELVQTLICISCDYTIKGSDTPNQLYLGDYKDLINDENFESFIIEAKNIAENLGF